MKYIKLLFLSLSFAATFTACDMTDFGDINKDPNEPSELILVCCLHTLVLM